MDVLIIAPAKLEDKSPQSSSPCQVFFALVRENIAAALNKGLDGANIYDQILIDIPGAVPIKRPENPKDAGIIRIGEFGFKFHQDEWSVAKKNYQTEAIRERLNNSKYCTRVLKYELLNAGREQNTVLACFTFVEGITGAQYMQASKPLPGQPLNPRIKLFWERLKQECDQAFKAGILISANEYDAVVALDGEKIKSLTFTDWNKIRLIGESYPLE